MNRQNLLILLCMLLLFPVSGQSNNREKYNFNPGWLLYIGDTPGAERTDFSDENWKKITLPRAFNEDEAFKVHIWGMTDTIAWYREVTKIVYFIGNEHMLIAHDSNRLRFS